MKKLIFILVIVLSFAGFAYADDAPEWLYQRHYIDTDTTRVYLDFLPLPYGPGSNFNAWLSWQEYTHFSPQPAPEYLFLGPLVWHGGNLRLGGYLEGFQFVRAYEGTSATSSLWFFRDGVELTTDNPNNTGYP